MSIIEMLERCVAHQEAETYITAVGSTNADMDQQDARYIAEKSSTQQVLPDHPVTWLPAAPPEPTNPFF